MNLLSPQAQIVLDPYDLWDEDFNSNIAQLAELSAVNGTVGGSNPPVGA